MRNRAGIVLVCRPTNEVAVIYRKKNEREYYVFPGGGVEKNETFEQAAVREAEEELGLEINNLTHLKTVIVNGGVEKYFISFVEDRVELRLQGAEINRSSQANIYIPRWIALDAVKDILIFPEEISKCIETNVEH